MFDIDGVFNAQNDRVWAVYRGEADEKDGRKEKRKFSQKSYGMAPDLLKRGYTIGYPGQRHHRLRQIH